MMMGLELFLLIGIIAFFVWGAQQGRSPFRRGESTQNTSALDILEERYAQGEIDRDEFQERRALLGR
ncbi:MAG TPA: SHOCT domain-containing protein [Acidimicrobiia bacterium]